ncbi:T9SS type A sorting domain-containing protein [Lewinella sp. IMCC34183]|uniref:T9SS type A sorting domain-containing protein n=1 Tax=Lewinella sp. IMCC34183 TaxID=2248762 RepID=UPI000E25608C|nr:T9SS type A sorting domain-containing protein [Lewinella sp. IMCC34183]
MRLFTLLCTCVLALNLQAQSIEQSVIGAAGALLTGGDGGSLHFTVGEIAVDKHRTRLTLAQGFHQSARTVVPASEWKSPRVDLDVRAFPNPTTDKLTLTGSWLPGDRVTLSSLLGRQLLDRALTPDQMQLSLRHLPAGTYLLSIRRGGEPVRTLRVARH